MKYLLRLSSALHPALYLLSVSLAWAKVELPPLFSDHMVLQKGAAVPIWGTAAPGEEITISYNGKPLRTKAGEDGKWMARLNLEDAPKAPFEIRISGENQIDIRDVLAGEVWLASGQSNMEFRLSEEQNGKEAMAASGNASLRFFNVEKNAVDTPQDTIRGQWVVASPQTSGPFSAVAYYFANRIQKELQSPVGVISSRWGGSPCEAWTSGEALDTLPDLKSAKEKLWSSQKSFPEARQGFLKSFDGWLKENQREDKPSATALAYAVESAGAGWEPIQLPGRIASENLPGTGAVWIRRDVDIPDVVAQNLVLDLPQSGAYPSIYWNGALLKSMTFQDTPLPGRIYIPAGKVKAGKNTLAVRFFAPVAPVRFFGTPKAGAVFLKGTWLAKSEYEFPLLEPQKVAAVPVPPPNPPSPHITSAYLYNGMIHPLIPYGIHGTIWYQGESNASRAFQYRTAFPLMIKDWRSRWQRGDFPFYFCQLANFMDKSPEPAESKWAELREAQHLTLKEPNTGEAVLIDIGESGDIHPLNKRDAGERLARIALAKEYGKNIAYSGPAYQSANVEGDKIRVIFTHTDGGLTARDLPVAFDVQKRKGISAPLTRNSPNSALEGFAICGADRKWVWADAKIDGEGVVVWSDKVAAPVAVRYGWADNPTCNLYNGAGLPASPFRSDEFPMLTAP